MAGRDNQLRPGLAGILQSARVSPQFAADILWSCQLSKRSTAWLRFDSPLFYTCHVRHGFPLTGRFWYKWAPVPSSIPPSFALSVHRTKYLTCLTAFSSPFPAMSSPSPDSSATTSQTVCSEEITNQALMSLIMDLRAQLTSMSRRQEQLMELVLNIRPEPATRAEP